MRVRCGLALGLLMAGAPLRASERGPRLAPNMHAAPIGNPGEWIGPDDYPPDALRAERQGRVVAVVEIDAGGKPTGCHVLESSGTTSLDDRTCAIAMAKGLFNPATDAQGHATAGEYRLPVRWTLPDHSSAAPIDIATTPLTAELVIEKRLDATGKTVGCRVVTDTRTAKSDPCAGFASWTAFLTPLTKGGTPIGGRVIQTVRQQIIPDP